MINRIGQRVGVSTLGCFEYGAAFVILLMLNFLLPRLIPGDPLSILYGSDHVVGMTAEIRNDINARLGMDLPLWEQFLSYIKGLIHLDLGYSYFYNADVSHILLRFAPWTLSLVAVVLTLTMVMGFLLGMEAVWHHGRWLDAALQGMMVALNSLPPVVAALVLLVVFGFLFPILPVSGATEPFSQATGLAWLLDVARHMVLPVSALSIHVITGIFFMVRSTGVTLVSRPFMMVGRAKGLPPRYLKYRYLGLNSLPPVVSRVGVTVSGLLTGVLYVEVIFSYPGLGTLAYESVMNHDYPVVQGVFLLVAVIIFIVNMLVDYLVHRLLMRG